MKEKSLCRQCQGEIHPERLAVAPRVTSCSHECAIGLKKEGNRLAAQRQRQRRRDMGEGLKPGSIIPKPGFAIPKPR